MRYAYVIGSNAFIVSSRVVVYRYNNEDKEFLRINSIYRDLPPTAEDITLNINLRIEDIDGSEINMESNKLPKGSKFKLIKERDFVKVLRPDDSLIIHIHQLDDKAAMSLEHNISAELDVNSPVVAIRITGEFLPGKLYVKAENEKFYINKNGYGNSVLNGKNQLTFSAEGIVL